MSFVSFVLMAVSMYGFVNDLGGKVLVFVSCVCMSGAASLLALLGCDLDLFFFSSFPVFPSS